MPPIINNNSSLAATLPFILLFFSCMVGHELALESLSTTYQQFPHLATSITLFQFGFCVLLPLLLSLGCSGGDVIRSFPRTRGQLFTYIKLSTVVYGATACATMSLGYEGITYVTKVVFKSAKLIPTMLVGVVMDALAERSGKVVKKRDYGAWEYSSAVLLCLGAAGFCMSPDDFGSKGESNDAAQSGGHWMGIGLLATSVVCDALVPNIQQQLMMTGTAGGNALTPPVPRKDSDDAELEMTSLISGKEEDRSDSIKHKALQSGGLSSSALMVNTNTVGFTILLLTTIFSGSAIPIVSFLATHPHFLLLHASVGLGLGTAVLAYTELIRRSGPAVAVAVATLRKVATVVLSYVIFPKPMTGVHVISGCLVAGGLAVGYVGRGRK
ncbi:hypothetical protein ACHAXT_000509 [Thalassiosira profunda]